MKTIFITGVTGNIGSRVLVEYLDKTNSKIIVLIRAADNSLAREKLLNTLCFWDANKDKYIKRIEIVLGDIALLNLGIEKSIYNRISNEITSIIHCASSLNLNLPIEKSRKYIYEATIHVINLGKECSKNTDFERFNYISTMEVAGNLESTVKEEYLINKQQKFHNTYEQAKYETEIYLKDLVDHDILPITIYRPSMVAGDSKNGKIINQQSIYLIMEKLLLNPDIPIVPSNNSFVLDVVPLDIVAKTIFICDHDAESKGKIYNITAGLDKAIKLPEFLDLVRDIYFDLYKIQIKTPKTVSPLFYKRILQLVNIFSFRRLKKITKINLMFLEFIFLSISFDNKNTRDILKNNNIEIPHIKDYLKNIVIYYEGDKDKKSRVSKTILN